MKASGMQVVRMTLSGFFLSVASPLVLAADTEIYSAKPVDDPRVMLLLDTSTSMFSGISKTDPAQRMATMKSVLHGLLDDLDGDYHVGLARYTSPGGAVVHPVARLDEPSAVERNFRGASDADDFVAMPTFDSSTDKLTLSAVQAQEIGIRIAAVNIPQGAEILSAHLVLTVADNPLAGSTDSVQLEARMAQLDNVAQVSSAVDYAAIPWGADIAQSATFTNLARHVALTVDVTAQVQARTLGNGWASGNAVMFRVSAPEGSVGVLSSEGADAQESGGRLREAFAPRLYVKYRVAPGNAGQLAPTTVRDALHAAVDAMPVNGDTPLIGAYYETLQYMLGRSVHFGSSRGSHGYKYLARSSTLVSMQAGALLNRPADCREEALDSSTCATESISGGANYQSPLSSDPCSIPPAVVMLTDGEPNNERCNAPGESNSVRCDLADVSADLAAMTAGAETPVVCDSTSAWDCGIKLSTVMANPERFGLANQTPIKTYTIGFAADVSASTSAARLSELASAGRDKPGQEDFNGGAFYAASNGDALADALSNIFEDVARGVQIQAATGIAVDQTNRAQHMDQLYFSMFEPSAGVLWPGNLKRYRLAEPAAAEGEYSIVDRKDLVAIDSAGQFKSTSTSFWTLNSDGDAVVKGGARAKIPASRDVYSFIDNYPASFDGEGVSLLKLQESLYTDAARAARLNTLFGVTDNVEGKALLNWMDGSDGQAAIMGAPVHSRPLLLHYGYDQADTAKPVNTLFFSTSQGVLHAVDTGTLNDAGNATGSAGEELFAFIPQEMLQNQSSIRNVQTGAPFSGLDASWVAYRHDENRDGAIDRDDKDFMYLYGGMRGGGRNYYALDVTDTQRLANGAPRLQFVITPDVTDNGEKPFAALGQTWSVPLITKLAGNCATQVTPCDDRVVMMFGGGYDPVHEMTGENMPTPATDALGASLYIVDARTGELLWSAGGSSSGADTVLAGMDHSITATLRVLDSDSDGYPDHVYAVDLGGQIMRFDFVRNAYGKSTFQFDKAQLVARLGGTAAGADAADFRRFYDAPAITPMRDGAGNRWVSVAVGSGYRSHPLNTETEEAFFMVRDNEPFAPAVDQPVITLADLENASLSSASGTDPQGWYMEFDKVGPTDAGEKVVGEPFVLNEQLVFSTYIPAAATTANECKADTGRMVMYQVQLRTAAGSMVDSDGELKRFEDNIATGLVSGVSLIQLTDADGKPVTLVNAGAGLTRVDLGEGRNFVRTRWRSNEGEARTDAEQDEIP